ncbi:hypothetical protein BCR32DRAFT_264276 [Anaeromyces robustus]|uniref:STB6-like N-terminal domain-containing protein n=1 Tax=Anaeromyces robustus TaxID=1754192 RepID=A0A1Y1XP51_9FUNG|nr:hypothetical protein BCR32DRAFT_264276 [Anaeromyces robustus]|eukprot:ORX87512.1 hypothetical protein BCR32DRAFT_264276 [Anaeromyces robustus]
MKMKLCMLEINSVYELMKENNSILIKENSLYLEGFQSYIILDWVTDRTRFCKTITVYTGNPEHKIHVCSVSFLSPNKEDYNGIIERLFKQYEKDKAKPKSLENNNIIMVTDLISFPTSLTTLPLTDGDYECHKLPLYININLKQFGCSGRGILTLKEPSDSQKNKFYQLFDIHTSVPFNFAILELGKIIQMSLYFLGMLQVPNCDDGLICDETIKAIRRAYISLGSKTEIDENGFSPILIKDIIKEVVDLIFKLHVLGYQSQKDPFRFPNNFERQIIAFKRNNGLRVIGEKSSELDILTIKKINTTYTNSVASTKHKYKGLEEKNDISFYFQHINVDRLKYLISGKKKNINENIKSMDNLKNIFNNSLMKLNDIKKNNIIQATQDMERPERRFLDILNADYDENDNEEINILNDENEIIEKEKEKDQEHEKEQEKEKEQELEKDNQIIEYKEEIQENDFDSLFKIANSNNILINLYHSNSTVETRTRQICENFDDYSFDENSMPKKIKEYKEYLKDSKLINKIKEYQKSKHNHSLNNKHLRKTKSFSDIYEIRRNIENKNKVIEISLKSYNHITHLLDLENECKLKMDKIKLYIKDYSNIIETCSKVYDKRYTESKKFENELNGIKENQNKLLSSLQDVDMLNSKQQYDISNVDEKLKDMEDLIEQIKNRKLYLINNFTF